ncbi:MAG: ATP-binding protein [Candidatus Heimdallarchaeaceae archaeon]
MKEVLKTIIKDFHERELPKLNSRDLELPLDTGKIVSIIGPRRAGKTYLVYQTIAELKKNIGIEKIVFINFADERLQMSSKDLQLIIDAYVELYPDIEISEVYFFFDEIHEVDKWSLFVRRIHETVSKNIYVTGSSAKLLSKEIATELRGRTLTVQVLPLSFKEFLSFKELDISDTFSTKSKAVLVNSFSKYLEFGGYPEIVLEDREELKIKFLQSYFDVMIYRDIIERYKIQNQDLLKKLALKGINNVAKEFSLFKTYNDIKSEGLKVSKDSVYEFMDYFEDVYLLFLLKQFFPSVQKQSRASKKVYCIDTGMVNASSFKVTENIGRQLENIVFSELLRQEKEFFFHKGKFECDFVMVERNKPSLAIQVCTKITEDNMKREINGLKEAMEDLKIKEGIIITLDQEDEVDGIKLIPAWKWLLTS